MLVLWQDYVVPPSHHLRSGETWIITFGERNLTDLGTSKAICRDPPPMSIMPTVRFLTCGLSSAPGGLITSSGSSEMFSKYYTFSGSSEMLGKYYKVIFKMYYFAVWFSGLFAISIGWSEIYENITSPMNDRRYHRYRMQSYRCRWSWNQVFKHLNNWCIT